MYDRIDLKIHIKHIYTAMSRVIRHQSFKRLNYHWYILKVPWNEHNFTENNFQPNKKCQKVFHLNFDSLLTKTLINGYGKYRFMGASSRFVIHLDIV